MHEILFGKLEEELKLRGRSLGTISVYRTEVGAFLKYFTGPLNELSMTDVKAYQLKLITAGYQNRTVNVRMAAVRFFCLYVLDREWAPMFTPRMKEPKSLPKYLSQEEFLRLIDTTPELRNRCIFTMLYSTGMRISELLNVKIEDLKKDALTIHVIGKGEKSRLVPFCAELRWQLRRYWYYDLRPVRTGYLFPSSHFAADAPLSRVLVYQTFKKAMRRAGIDKKCGLHALRHSFATELLRLGVSIREIQILLGHSHMSTTEIYTHLTTAQVGAIENPLSGLFKKDPTAA